VRRGKCCAIAQGVIEENHHHHHCPGRDVIDIDRQFMDPFVPARDPVRFDGHNQEKTLYFPLNTIQYNTIIIIIEACSRWRWTGWQ
jgi:hypothetical protein